MKETSSGFTLPKTGNSGGGGPYLIICTRFGFGIYILFYHFSPLFSNSLINLCLVTFLAVNYLRPLRRITRLKFHFTSSIMIFVIFFLTHALPMPKLEWISFLKSFIMSTVGAKAWQY